jgi:Fic family protein
MNNTPCQYFWNWQQKDWPEFVFDSSLFQEMERHFLKNSGFFLGIYQHIDQDSKQSFMIDILSDEALQSSEIEGEILNRESLQSSIRRNFGLSTTQINAKASEIGMAELMFDLHESFAPPLTHDLLFKWHKMLMKGRNDLQNIGGYRKHKEPMQIVSGKWHEPSIHFEAPPSEIIEYEMERFIIWFNNTSLPSLIKASISHLYFESIHPFEDGNGRIGRVIVEKSLSQSINQPILIALSQTINSKRETYYDMLERSNKSNYINDWIKYFAQVILDAQNNSINLTEFIVKKVKFFDKFKSNLNNRQLKVVERVFREGLHGFKGGLSAENYIRITGTSRATATRDLQDLIHQNAFTKTGTGKGTRYQIR